MNDTEVEKIIAEKQKLMPVKDPTTLMAGGIDVDAELHILALNLRVLTKLKCLIGFEVVRFEQAYNKATMDTAKEWTSEKLKDIGIVASDKFKWVKICLADQYAETEKRRIEYRYFDDLMQTYREWIMIYKKTRMLGAE